MRTIGLAEYFKIKYAGYEEFEGGEPDTSFGAPVNAAKARLLKDKIILSYEKVAEGLARLPIYQELAETLKGEFFWDVFQDLINNLAAKIEFMNLKEGFSFSIKMVDALNQLRNALVSGPIQRNKLFELDNGIKVIQDYIWKESKRFLNIHDLRGMLVDVPELKGIVNKIVPTWDYGPGKNPSKGLLQKRNPNSSGKLMKRLLKEMEEEKDK